MNFTKMHGLGNDYIFVYTDNSDKYDYGKIASIISPRCFGVGADGLITISPSLKADFAMRIYNLDGSEAQMCGNGIRCVGKYVYENGLTTKKELTIETLAGIKKLKLTVKNGEVLKVSVDMGIPTTLVGQELKLEDVIINLQVNDKDYEIYNISMGNPHAVIFVSELTDELVKTVGPLIENHPYYKDRTNVEFVKVIDNSNVNMRVWERGSGETMACGTGSCATYAAFCLKYNSKNKLCVHLRGGDLTIHYNKEGHIIMEGSATKVYDGQIALNKILDDIIE